MSDDRDPRIAPPAPPLFEVMGGTREQVWFDTFGDDDPEDDQPDA